MEQSGTGGMVLVTGGSGFLGAWTIIELLKRGHRVRATVRDLAREPMVRAMVGQEVDPGDRLELAAADLTADDGWTDAAAGCSHVLHVASPFPPEQPEDPDELIVPARDGTLRVLTAALDSGVQRVVVTSSVAAIRNTAGPQPEVMTEEHWTDSSNTSLTPYTRSKAIAERAAWDLVEQRGEKGRLAVVNPGAILGPVLSDDLSFSLQAVQRLLGGMPGVPKLGFTFVDVRDVAALQVLAMTAPDAAGERFIAATEFLWMSEVAQILRDRLGEDGTNVPTRTIPSFMVRAMSLVDPSLKSIVSELGKKTTYSKDKAVRLGWSPRPVADTVEETARSLLALEKVAAGS